MKLLHAALAASLLATELAHAVVVTDGSLGGRQVTLKGNFDIPSDLGRTVDTNLFHSFASFDLATGESATFRGPPEIRNIISRVTGGHPSDIDGHVASGIRGANLYLVNPSGIVFGPNATLNVSGSFYATTADYLELGSVRFDATATPPPENFTLAVASPSAFGFLGPNPASIEVADSRLSTRPGSGRLNFIGGDLRISHWTGADKPVLDSPCSVTLVSVGSEGKAVLSGSGIDTRSFSEMGTATVLRNPELGKPPDSKPAVSDISTATGRIFISAGSFTVNGAYLASDTTDASTSGGVTISARDRLEVSKGGVIRSSSATGTAGDIGITASGSFTVDGVGSGIQVQSGKEASNAGNLSLAAEALSIANGAYVINSASPEGEGGNIDITADKSVTVSGYKQQGHEVLSIIRSSGSGNLSVDAPEVRLVAGGIDGNGGALQITGKNLSLESGSHIRTNPGTISIVLTDTLRAESGGSIIAMDPGTVGDNSAGISITARDVVLKGEHTRIGTDGGEATGDVAIHAVSRVSVDGGASIYIGNWKEDRRVGITISASDLEVTNGGRINSVANINQADVKITLTGDLTVSGPGSLVRSNTLGDRNAGDITISAANVFVEGGGAIDTWVGDPETPNLTQGSGNGGSILLNATESVVIDGSSIDKSGLHPSRIDVSTKGKGNAGSIDLHAKALQLLDGGEIRSSAEEKSEGAGGRITITAT